MADTPLIKAADRLNDLVIKRIERLMSLGRNAAQSEELDELYDAVLAFEEHRYPEFREPTMKPILSQGGRMRVTDNPRSAEDIHE